MRKIGILTFHRSINYGAFLQALSLQENLQERLVNSDIEIINFNTVKMELFYIFDIVRDPKSILKKLCLYKNFKEGLQLLNTSTKCIISGSEEKIIRYINATYDTVIVGSDEVWKINYQRKFPNAFWLSDRIQCEKLSYAASANRTDFSMLSNSEKSEIQKRLNEFKYIGVRDENTKFELEKITSNTIYKNPDPTILYSIPDMKDSVREHLESKYKLDLEEPIIAVMTKNRKIFQMYKDAFKHAQIINLGQHNKYADRFIYDLNPIEWANSFSFFDLCVTRLFHGTIFSLKQKCEFITVDHETYYKDNICKTYDLLNDIGISERYISTGAHEFNDEELIQISRELLENQNLDYENKYERYLKDQVHIFEEFCRVIGE